LRTGRTEVKSEKGRRREKIAEEGFEECLMKARGNLGRERDGGKK